VNRGLVSRVPGDRLFERHSGLLEPPLRDPQRSQERPELDLIGAAHRGRQRSVRAWERILVEGDPGAVVCGVGRREVPERRRVTKPARREPAIPLQAAA
jgi:hypothetical protein